MFLVALPPFRHSICRKIKAVFFTQRPGTRQFQGVPQTHCPAGVLEGTCLGKTKENDTNATQVPLSYYVFKGKPCICQRENDGYG